VEERLRILSVVDNDKLVGIITYRDICIALGTRNRRAAETRVKHGVTHHLQKCQPGDDVNAAIEAMRHAKMRRLPVISTGMPEGIRVLNDLALAADRGKREIDYDEVINTVTAASEHHDRKPLAPDKLKFRYSGLPFA
jgi:CBS domain-containing protein